MDKATPPGWFPVFLHALWPAVVDFRNRAVTILVIALLGYLGMQPIVQHQERQQEAIELQNERLLEQNRLQAAELSLRHAEHEYWQIPTPAAAVEVRLKQP